MHVTLANFKGRSVCAERCSPTADQDVPILLCLDVHYRFQESSHFQLILFQSNPVHIFTQYFFGTHLNRILPLKKDIVVCIAT